MPRGRRGWAIGRGGDGQMHHSPLAVSLLEPVLLMLIQEQARHGYTLLTDLENLGIRTIHPSVIYRTLREMESLEWIQSDWDSERTQGPPRRTYRLTGQGKDALQNWKHELHNIQGLIAQLLERIETQERR